MKAKIVYCLLFLLASSWVMQSKAQGFYIRTTDLKVKTIDLSTIQSLSFPNNSLLLKKTTGSTETFNLSTLSVLYFNSLYTSSKSLEVISKDEKLSVYPNPASSVLRIVNFSQQTGVVSVIGMDGHTVLQTRITQESPVINISGLAKGLYIIRVNNQAIKFIRQ
jgi:hypothetical protein